MNPKELRLFLEESLEDSSKKFIEEISEYYIFVQKSKNSKKDDWVFLLKKSKILFVLLDNDLTMIRLRDSLFKEEFHRNDMIWDEFSFELRTDIGDSDGVAILLSELGFEVEHC